MEYSESQLDVWKEKLKQIRTQAGIQQATQEKSFDQKITELERLISEVQKLVQTVKETKKDNDVAVLKKDLNTLWQRINEGIDEVSSGSPKTGTGVSFGKESS